MNLPSLTRRVDPGSPMSLLEAHSKMKHHCALRPKSENCEEEETRKTNFEIRRTDCGPGPNAEPFSQCQLNLQDELRYEGNKHTLQQNTILTENLSLEKLQGELAAERLESTIRRGAIAEQSADLIMLQTELETGKNKSTLQEDIIAKQDAELADLKRRTLVDLEKSESLEKRIQKIKSEIQKAQADLHNEKEKLLCVICFERPRRALCMPCLHFYYCKQCLEGHLKTNKSCPYCRTLSRGVLECFP